MYSGFPVAMIPALRCSKDGGQLTFASTDKMHIVEGEISCKSCGSTFEIKEGIVCMLEDSHLEPEMALEAVERDKNASEYDRHFSERYEREVVPTMNIIGNVSGKTVIEYGAGTGRLTVTLAKACAFFLATDMSFTSLQALAKKDIPQTCGLVWTEAAGLRTSPRYFDAALTFQMIEHMPQAVRDRFYASVAQTLKKGGLFVASVYHQDLRRRFQGLPQDGKHPNGIYFHCFEKSEFRKELSKEFSVHLIRPTDVVVPLQSRLHLPITIDGYVSRFFAFVPVVKDYGHIIVAKSYLV